MELTIGPRLYSTWSLRGWLVMKRAGAEFSVRSVEYASAAQKAALRDHSPTGLVPLLQVKDRLHLGHSGHCRVGGRNLSASATVARRPCRAGLCAFCDGGDALRFFRLARSVRYGTGPPYCGRCP